MFNFQFLFACLVASAAMAQSPVTVTIGTNAPGPAIPEEFIGMSFGMKVVAGSRFFTATNTPLITLFTNLGLRHLRVGGTTVESPPTIPVPGERDIDNLFAFVRAAQVRKVIYSLPLLETNAALHYAEANAALAKYIWNHYRDRLDCYAIGNEPDRRGVFDKDVEITNFSSYMDKWRRFAAAITNAVPEAKFAGPDAGSGNVDWTTGFGRATRDDGYISVVTEHFYVGGAGRRVTEPRDGIDAILSAKWLGRCQNIYDNVTVPVLADGLRFRFTEANDYYSGGAKGASETFASALWALDFLHWWAAHVARGVDFHNTQWVVNDVITPDPSGQLTVNPKAYGLKAFDLGGHGNVEPVMISNPDNLNVTAYAVRGDGGHYATLINKEHGSGARPASVAIVASGSTEPAVVIILSNTSGDAAAKTGVTIGGATISSDGPWLGKWSPLPAQSSGHYALKVSPVSAVVVRIPAR